MELQSKFRKDWSKDQISEHWIAPRIGRIERVEFTERFLPLIIDVQMKSMIATRWLQQGVRIREDLAEVFPFFTDENAKSNIATEWFRQGVRSREDLMGVLPLIRDSKKREVTISFLTNNNDEESKYNDLIHLVSSGHLCSKYDLREIVSIYSKTNLTIERFPEFCKNLYPNNENIQSEIFCEGIGKFAVPDLSQSKANFLKFITEFRSDEEAIESLRTLKQRINLRPLEILEAASNRINPDCESISELLRQKKAVDSIDPQGSETIRTVFLADGGLPEETNLASLFSFYCITQENGSVAFKSFLKTETANEMREQFTHSDKSVLVLKRDFDAMVYLLDASDDLGFLPVSALSGKLSQCANFNNLPLEEIERYQFGKSELLRNFREKDFLEVSDEQITGIITNFVDLLRSVSASSSSSRANGIVDYFEEVFPFKGQERAGERQHLEGFFAENKSNLLTLLEKDGEGSSERSKSECKLSEFSAAISFFEISREFVSLMQQSSISSNFSQF